jgi:hypothetical protein
MMTISIVPLRIQKFIANNEQLTVVIELRTFGNLTVNSEELRNNDQSHFQNCSTANNQQLTVMIQW